MPFSFVAGVILAVHERQSCQLENLKKVSCSSCKESDNDWHKRNRAHTGKDGISHPSLISYSQKQTVKLYLSVTLAQSPK